jgi:hypothetical protein
MADGQLLDSTARSAPKGHQNLVRILTITCDSAGVELELSFLDQVRQQVSNFRSDARDA